MQSVPIRCEFEQPGSNVPMPLKVIHTRSLFYDTYNQTLEKTEGLFRETGNNGNKTQIEVEEQTGTNGKNYCIHLNKMV
jgi:hypothetical protein